MKRTDSLEKTLMLGKTESGGEGDNRGRDGWMASPTQRTRVWVSSGSWWWTGRPGVLQAMGSQRVGHNWATELNWTERDEGDINDTCVGSHHKCYAVTWSWGRTVRGWLGRVAVSSSGWNSQGRTLRPRYIWPTTLESEGTHSVGSWEGSGPCRKYSESWGLLPRVAGQGETGFK